MLAVLVGCSGDGSPDYPVGGGGFDGGTTSDGTAVDSHANDALANDAGVDAQPATVDAALIMGRVCLANDPRKLNTCADTGAGGLTVRLGSNVTTTGVDGRFTIAAGSGTWRVTGANIVTSVMTLADYEIPAIPRATFDSMITTNLGGLTPNPGEGSVMIQVIRNGAGLAAATASSTPPSAWQPFYDNPASATDWNQGAAGTGADGTIWLVGLDVGTASVTVGHPNDMPRTDSGVPIVDGAITFTTIIFP